MRAFDSPRPPARRTGLRGAPAAGAGHSALQQIAAAALLAFALSHYLGVWLWPTLEYGDTTAHTGMGGVQTHVFRVFYVGSAAFIVHVAMLRGLHAVVRCIAVFGPFFATGLVATAAGDDWAGGLRLMGFWLLMALTAASIALAMDESRLQEVLVGSLSVFLLGSVLAVLVLPSNALQTYGQDAHWRGLFSNKNQLGWISAVALVVACFATPTRRPFFGLRWLLITLCVACLVGASSKTAMVAAAGSIGVWTLALWLRRRVTPATAGLILITMSAGIAALLAINLPVLEALVAAMGRDLTFTGRTSIWATYWQDISGAPWLGRGPGAYTGVSPFTAALAHRLMEFGQIYTPHNMYLGALGDGGIIGLVALLGAYGAVLVKSLRGEGPPAAGALVLLIGITGLTETLPIFAPGPGAFVLLLLVASQYR